MYGFTRTKRVTDPLDDKVKARIVGRDRIDFSAGYVSSGSEHSAHADDDVTSSSLSEIFFGFDVAGNGDGDDASPEREDELDSEHDPYDFGSRNVEMVRPILLDRTDEFRNVLEGHVFRAVEAFACVRSDKRVLRRNVMAFLRGYGYNAAVCKTKWESCGGLTAGSYEFVEVLGKDDGASVRYFVDLDFASEFEIARPTSSYERMVQCLPTVFVGKSDGLRQILKAASDAARRSLKSRGLHLPPWRKHRFMQNKWLGPYRRTTNLFPATFAAAGQVKDLNCAVKSRAVGFDAAVDGGRFLFATAARTR